MFHRRKLICNRSGIIIIIIIILNFIITYHNIHDLIHFFVDIQNAKKPKNRASDIESGMAWHGFAVIIILRQLKSMQNRLHGSERQRERKTV